MIQSCLFFDIVGTTALLIHRLQLSSVFGTSFNDDVYRGSLGPRKCWKTFEHCVVSTCDLCQVIAFSYCIEHIVVEGRQLVASMTISAKSDL